MTSNKLKSVPSTEFNVEIKGKKASVVIDKAESIPLTYMRTIPAVAARSEPDKALLYKALKDSEGGIEGCHLGESTKLSIK